MISEKSIPPKALEHFLMLKMYVRITLNTCQINKLGFFQPNLEKNLSHMKFFLDAYIIFCFFPFSFFPETCYFDTIKIEL